MERLQRLAAYPLKMAGAVCAASVFVAGFWVLTLGNAYDMGRLRMIGQDPDTDGVDHERLGRHNDL